MNTFTRMAVASVAFAAVSASALAQTFLNNWYLDPDGPGGTAPLLDNEFANFDGYSFLQNTYSDASNFTFLDDGFFRWSSTDNGASLVPPAVAAELTMLLTGATGVGVMGPGGGGAIAFTPGGALTIYSDPAPNYTLVDGDNGLYYGANDGLPIGSFTIQSGNSAVTPSGLPGGPMNIVFENTAPVTCGYFFSGPDFTVGGPDDLCNVGSPFLLAFTTINSSRTTNPPAGAAPELVCDLAGVSCPTGVPFDVNATTLPAAGLSQSFIIANNGQFRFSVPEPSAIALLGLGLAGLVLGRRKSRA